MAQADQSVQNATFPTVRADINNNLAALFSDNSGNTAPSVTVAFQDWIDTSGANPLWKKRNAANNAWVTIATIDGNEISFLGASTLPDQSGNSGKYLSTDGTDASWAALALGATVQTFTSSGTFTPTAGKVSFLVFCTGGGGGGGGADYLNGYGTGGGGGGGGTAVRMYTSAEMGSTAAVTVGGGGAGGAASTPVDPGPGGAGGTSTFDPDGSGLTITGVGGSGGNPGKGIIGAGGAGGTSTNSQFSANGQRGDTDIGGTANPSSGGGTGGITFWASGIGSGGAGAYAPSGTNRAGTAGTAGGVFILEF